MSHSEIKTQIKRIDAMINSEKQIYEAMKNYMECEIKTKIMDQCLGAIRGLEAGKESLDFLQQNNRDPEQITTEEWLDQEKTIKDITNQIDTRGGMVREIHHPDGRRELKLKPITGDLLAYKFPDGPGKNQNYEKLTL